MNLSGVNLGQMPSQTTAQPASYQEGQVVHGAIKKIYPGDQAEINIGGQKLMAKLETPVQAGNAHFFQVTATEPELKLKMVSSPLDTKASSMEQMKQLMDSMKLPQSKEMQQLVLQLVKNNTPFNKEQLLVAEQLLKGVKGAERSVTLEALQKMIDLKLPMTKDILQSVIQGGAKTGFADLLTTLESAVAKDQSLTAALKQQVLNQLSQLKSPLLEQTGSMTLGKLLHNNVNDRSVQTMLQQLNIVPKDTTITLSDQLYAKLKTAPNEALKILLNQDLTAKKPLQALAQIVTNHPTFTDAQKQTMQQAIAKMQLAPSEAHQAQLVKTITNELAQTKDNIVQLLSQLKTSSAAEQPALIQKLATMIANDGELTIAQKQTIIQSLANSSNTAAKNALQTIVSAFAEQLGQNPSEQAKTQIAQLLGVSKAEQSNVFQALAKLAEQSNSPLVQQLLAAAETEQATQITGQSIHLAMKKTLSELGLSLEARMLQENADNKQLADTLKSLMHAVLKDQPTTATKNAAELIVARMNGQQLLSVENGPQQQIIMQVPLNFYGKRTEATLQWSGNKDKENRKIDSNFARVMFYLQLENMQETVIDMQVQSRVISLTIYTEKNAVKGIDEALKNMLKANLEQRDYHLSGIFLKNFIEKAPAVKQQVKNSPMKSESGVDFKI